MRLSNQFKIIIAVFTVVLVVISASILATSGQISQTRTQENIANSALQSASELTYLSNQYVIYREDFVLSRWQSTYAAISNDIGNLTVNSPDQQALVQEIKDSQQNMKTVFDSIVTIIRTSQNLSTNTTTAAEVLETSWSRMAISSQIIITDSTRLSQLLRSDVDQLNLRNIELILVAIATFSVFIAVIYLQTFRRTLKSISELQTGTKVIGSGNLDYKLKESSKDEIGDLSRSFNQMTSNLKAVTASKTELENEVAQRKQAEEALKRSEERFRLALKNSPITLIELGSDLRFKWVYNPLINRTADELVGLRVGETGTTKDITPLKGIYNEVLKTGVAKRSEVKLGHTGRIAYYDIYAEPIRNDKGEVIGLSSVSTDITELKKTEDALRQAQFKLQEYATNLEHLVEQRTRQLKESERMATIGQTAGMVGHDIRNPLQAITGDLYLLKIDAKEIPNQESKQSALETIDGINENISYINKIVADLQDYARKTEPNLQELDLEEAIDKVFSTINVPKNIEANCTVEPNIKLRADETYIRRIITNLTTNAIQAMPHGGKLTVEAIRKDQGKTVQITVEDTGGGIPKDLQDKLFKPLFTTKSKGQGFGLAVVKKFVEELGGTITFGSQEGKGTKFIVSLPA